jgi:hypothetical protein
MMIGDGLTLGMKANSHALHPRSIVTDAEVALLEDAEPGVELQNTRLMIAEELSLICGLRQFPNDLVELRGEGAEDPCHQDVVLFPLSGSGRGSGGDLLLIDGEVGGAARHGQQDGGGGGWR